MKQIVAFSWPKELGFEVSEMIFGCFDRRIRGWRNLLSKSMGFETAYPLLIPGGPMDLVMPKDSRDSQYLLEKIELIERKGNLKKIYVMAHNGCKACEEITDIGFYEGLLREAGRILRDRFPLLEIVLVFVDFDGVSVVEEEETALTAVA